jgi:hypothetical protein
MPNFSPPVWENIISGLFDDQYMCPLLCVRERERERERERVCLFMICKSHSNHCHHRECLQEHNKQFLFIYFGWYGLLTAKFNVQYFDIEFLLVPRVA